MSFYNIGEQVLCVAEDDDELEGEVVYIHDHDPLDEDYYVSLDPEDGSDGRWIDEGDLLGYDPETKRVKIPDDYSGPLPKEGDRCVFTVTSRTIVGQKIRALFPRDHPRLTETSLAMGSYWLRSIRKEETT